MRIKHVSSAYVFEAHEDAAKELIARGDYEKATKADEAPSTKPAAPPRKKRTK